MKTEKEVIRMKAISENTQRVIEKEMSMQDPGIAGFIHALCWVLMPSEKHNK